jgi:uncharacterized protein
MSALLLIFAKAPVPGQVKTRLSPPLTPAQAAALYGCFLQDVLTEMAGLEEMALAVAYNPASAREFFLNSTPDRVHLVAQAGADLGARLLRAFDWGFAQGYEAVLIRNSDSPDLPGAFIREGREVLLSGRADVVLGPCPDGGYYLVGLRRPCPELFQGIAWSTDAVLQQTLGRSGRLGLRPHLLPSWADIDDLNGLRNFLQKPLTPPAPGWRSFAWARKFLPSSLLNPSEATPPALP